MRQLLVRTCVLRVQLLPSLGKTIEAQKFAAFHTHAVNVHCKFLAAGRVSINQLRLAPVFHECTSILLCVCITQHRIHLFGNGGCQKKEERMEDEVK